MLFSQVTISRELTEDDDLISLEVEPEGNATFMEVLGMLEIAKTIWLREHDAETD